MPASPHTTVTHIEQAQAQKEVTANAAFDRISNFLAETRTYAGVAGDVTPGTVPPDFEWQGALRFVLQGTPGAQVNFNAPADAALKKLFLLDNQLDASVQVQVTGGAGAKVVVPLAERRLLYSDGADVLEVGGGGDFLALADTPASYAGHAGKAAVVKASEDGLEFGTVAGGGGGGAAGSVQTFRGALVVQNAPTSLPNATTTTPIDFQVAKYDTDGFYDPASPGRLTVPAGIRRLRVRAQIRISANTAGDRGITLFRNGAVEPLGEVRLDGTEVTGVQTTLQLLTPVLDVSSGDYFELGVPHNAGGTLQTSGGDTTWFSVEVAGAELPVAAPRGALVRKTANQTLANSVAAIIAFDQEVYDTAGIHDNATNNTRLTVPAGVSHVRLSANLSFSASPSPVVAVLRKNGAATEGGFHWTNTTTSTGEINMASAVLKVAPGDYFELQVTQFSGANRDVVANASTWFSMEVVDGPALINVGKARAFSGAHLNKTATQPATVDTAVTVQWDAEEFDDGNWADLSANNTRLTVPEGARVVEVTCGVAFSSSATGDRTVTIRKNGTDNVAAAKWDASSASDLMTVTTGPLKVSAGDYFEVEVTSSGVTTTILNVLQTFFAIRDVDSGVVPSLPDGAHVRNSIAQSIATGAWTALGFDTQDFDTKGFHDTVTNNSRIAIPGGVTHVRLTARAAFAPHATGVRGLRITRNGVVFGQGAKALVPAAGGTHETVVTISTGLIEVAVGDYFEAEAFQTSGAGLNVQADSWLNVEAVTGVAAPTFRGALVGKSADQSIAVGVQVVTWDQETFDTGGLHDAANPSRLTVPAGVRKVRLHGQVQWASSGSTNVRELILIKNGLSATYAGRPHHRIKPVVGSPTTQNFSSPPLTVAPGDYFEVQVQHDVGAPLNLLATDSHFAMEIVE